MPSNVGSPYPGGPRRPDGEAKAPSARPSSTEDRYVRGTEKRKRLKRRKRQITQLGVIVVAALVAAGIGYVLGDQASSEATWAREGGQGPMTTEELINSELNRVLLELWKMEELERR